MKNSREIGVFCYFRIMWALSAHISYWVVLKKNV